MEPCYGSGSRFEENRPPSPARAQLHVHQTSGGQGIDAGLVDVRAGASLLPQLAPPAPVPDATPGARWPAERARAWRDALPPLAGCNYLPRTAINSVEMWRAETFDERTIERVRASGFEAAFATGGGWVDASSPRFALPRVDVRPDATVAVLAAEVSGLLPRLRRIRGGS